jgi:hypothetical protein
VRLADAKAVDEVKQDPAAALAKAKKLAAEQPAKPKHVHQPAPAKAEPKAEPKPEAKDGAKATEGAK